MDRINLNPLDKKDLLELLEYARQKKLEDDINSTRKDHFRMGKYWDMRIEQLKDIVNGSIVDIGIQSTMRTMQNPLTKKEKAHFKYMKNVERDIIDLMDYIESKKEGEVHN